MVEWQLKDLVVGWLLVRNGKKQLVKHGEDSSGCKVAAGCATI